MAETSSLGSLSLSSLTSHLPSWVRSCSGSIDCTESMVSSMAATARRAYVRQLYDPRTPQAAAHCRSAECQALALRGGLLLCCLAMLASAARPDERSRLPASKAPPIPHPKALDFDPTGLRIFEPRCSHKTDASRHFLTVHVIHSRVVTVWRKARPTQTKYANMDALGAALAQIAGCLP